MQSAQTNEKINCGGWVVGGGALTMGLSKAPDT